MSTPETLHALYCRLTGFQVPFTLGRNFEWERFGTQFTAEDLELVVTHIKDLKRQGRNCRDLKLRSLISGPNSMEFFAEDLAEARAMRRAPRRDEKTRVLAATGRAVKEKAAESASLVLERLKMAEMLKGWREELL